MARYKPSTPPLSDEDILKIEHERKTLYVCDPTKATGCKKTGCKHNPNATYPECDRTSHVEWAALDADGRPILDERSDDA